MNSNKTFRYLFFGLLSLFLLSGCSVPTITADYKMPAEMITNIADINIMDVDINVSLSGNRINYGDDSIAKSVIARKIVAGFYQNGHYKTTDYVWGSQGGDNKLFTLAQNKSDIHGYARLAALPITKKAKLELTFNANISSYARDLNVKTNLKRVQYIKIYTPRTYSYTVGENNYYRTYNVPSTIPGSVSWSSVYSNVKQYEVTAKGTLQAKVTDKNGKVVYNQSFPNLKFYAKCDHLTLAALPNNAHILSQLSNAVVSKVVKHLSPYTERKVLKINKDGDEKAFLLLEALAFSEAVAAYENIPEKERTFADWENYGIVCEVLGDFETARNCYLTAIRVKKADKGIFDYDKQIAENGIARLDKITKKNK
jgi:tetratricopeptide (TPR) repeat protein